MALIVCPECGGKVSDKASACPHCGFPLQDAVHELKERQNDIGNDLQNQHITTIEEILARRSNQPKNAVEWEKDVLECIVQHNPVTISDIKEIMGVKGRDTDKIRKAVHALEEKKAIIGDLLHHQTYYSLFDKDNPREPIHIFYGSEDATKYGATVENMTAVIKAKEALMAEGKSLMLPHVYESFERGYKGFADSYGNYHLAALNNVGSLLSQRDALAAKKVDPAIAGGLASGVAGVGAGAYCAWNQNQRNKSIDLTREAANIQVQNTSLAKTLAQKAAEQDFYYVMSYVNTYPKLESLFLEEQAKVKKENEEKKREEERKKPFLWRMFH